MTAIRRSAFCELVGSSLLTVGVGCARAPTTIPALGSVTWQLGWLENVAYAGSYIAEDRGYYRAQGIDVIIRPGGPSTAVEPLLVAGKALLANSTVGLTAQARASGAPLKVVAACWQHDPEVFISLASKPLRTPRELVGKRLGIPSADLVDAKGFLHANGIEPDQFQVVPVQYDPAPLVAGEVDAYFGFSTNEAVALLARGVPIHLMHVEDFGYSGLFQVYSVREDSLTDPVARKRLLAFLRAERLGWRDALRDPDLGVDLTLKKYGATLGLNRKQQSMQSRAQNLLVTSSDTQAHGLLWMSPPKIAAAVASLAREGIPVRATDLFDTSLLAELNART